VWSGRVRGHHHHDYRGHCYVRELSQILGVADDWLQTDDKIIDALESQGTGIGGPPTVKSLVKGARQRSYLLERSGERREGQELNHRSGAVACAEAVAEVERGLPRRCGCTPA